MFTKQILSKAATKARVSPYLVKQATFNSPLTKFTPTQTRFQTTTTEEPVSETKEEGNHIVNRFISTLEVSVSKIFPAGFGWQYGSVIADNMGLTPNDLGFFLTTGLGDLTGVFLGHTLYYSIRNAITGGERTIADEAGTGWFLGSAAFCSGSVWQPTVNFLQAAQLPFTGVAVGTWVICGAAFYGGLRLGRLIYPFIDNGAYWNIKYDAALSVSIGGATGAFVGTDTAYLPEENFLKGVVGVEDADSAITGCVKAGSATSIGFVGSQAVQNATYFKGRNWIDP